MGTLNNGTSPIAWSNPNAPGLAWQKSSKTELTPILKDCVIVADAGQAKDFGHPSVPDGTRLVAVSDDKREDSPVLLFSRAEFTKFIQGAKDGEFDLLLATEQELQLAAV